MTHHSLRAPRRAAVAAAVLAPMFVPAAQAASWLQPGTPQFSVTAVDATGADLRASWAAPRFTRGVTYAYRGGTNSGASWSISGKTSQRTLTLNNVPTNGSYWFCVDAVSSRGQVGGTACNSFSTPVAASAPPPAPAAEPVVAPAEPEVTGPRISECAASKAEWIWCDDFESDRLASYFEATMPRRSGTGIGGSTAVVGSFPAGGSSGGSLKVAFGRTPSSYFRAVDGGDRNYREIYWRVYLKHPAGWQGGGADKLSRATVFAGGGWQQAMIAHIWSGADPGPQQNYLNLDPASGTDSSGSLRTTQYNDFANLRWLGATTGKTAVFDAQHQGQWQCIEARVRLNDAGQANGEFQLWVNGTLDAARTGLNWLGSYSAYGLNAVFLENYWNAGSPVEQERYMDNFVVSTARIGCG